MTPYMKTAAQPCSVLYNTSQLLLSFSLLPCLPLPHCSAHVTSFSSAPQDAHHLFSHFSQMDEVCLFILLKDATKPRNNTPHLTFYWFHTSSGINPTKINNKGLLASSLKDNCKTNSTSETVIQIFLAQTQADTTLLKPLNTSNGIVFFLFHRHKGENN